jgi:hypothetical protein
MRTTHVNRFTYGTHTWNKNLLQISCENHIQINLCDLFSLIKSKYLILWKVEYASFFFTGLVYAYGWRTWACNYM